LGGPALPAGSSRTHLGLLAAPAAAAPRELAGDQCGHGLSSWAAAARDLEDDGDEVVLGGDGGDGDGDGDGDVEEGTDEGEVTAGGSFEPLTAGALLDRSAMSRLLTPSVQVQLVFGACEEEQEEKDGLEAQRRGGPAEEPTSSGVRSSGSTGLTAAEAVACQPLDHVESTVSVEEVERILLMGDAADSELSGSRLQHAASGGLAPQAAWQETQLHPGGLGPPAHAAAERSASPLPVDLSGLLAQYRQQAQQTAAVLSGIATASTRQEEALRRSGHAQGEGGSGEGRRGWVAAELPVADGGARPASSTASSEGRPALESVRLVTAATQVSCTAGSHRALSDETPSHQAQHSQGAAAASNDGAPLASRGCGVQALLDLAESLTPLPAPWTAAAGRGGGPEQCYGAEDDAPRRRRLAPPHSHLDAQSLLQPVRSPEKGRPRAAGAGSDGACGGHSGSAEGNTGTLLGGAGRQAPALAFARASGPDQSRGVGSNGTSWCSPAGGCSSFGIGEGERRLPSRGTQTTPMLGRGGAAGDDGEGAADAHTQVTPGLRV
jgi:hypothetical protein